MARYWAVRLGERGKYVEAGRNGNYIAIEWNQIVDPSWLTQENVRPKKLNDMCENVYDGSTRVGPLDHVNRKRGLDYDCRDSLACF